MGPHEEAAVEGNGSSLLCYVCFGGGVLCVTCGILCIIRQEGGCKGELSCTAAAFEPYMGSVEYIPQHHLAPYVRAKSREMEAAGLQVWRMLNKSRTPEKGIT